MHLDELGPRVCILGPSNSGKSTLAVAIGRQRGLPVVHLDQLFHRPHTDWEPRPEAEFLALHEVAIAEPAWVMEGNYTRCLAPRLERATGLILLDVSTLTSLLRYVRRCWSGRERHGALEGRADSVKWDMVHHICVVTPANRKRYASLYEGLRLPKVMLASPQALRRFYLEEGV